MKSNHSGRPPLSRCKGVDRLLIMAKAENGAYQVAKMSIKRSGLLQACGSAASRLNASWPDWNNSGWMMLSIPPISANGRRDFCNHSKRTPFFRLAEIFSRWSSVWADSQINAMSVNNRIPRALAQTMREIYSRCRVSGHLSLADKIWAHRATGLGDYDWLST